MAENKSWKVMCWNVRGLNSDKKWNSIRDKIIESRCDIACLQETKKDFLIITLSEIVAQVALIPLLSKLQLVLQEGC